MKTVTENRRPGIVRISAAVKIQHPLWSENRVQCEAKVRWTALYKAARPKSLSVFIRPDQNVDIEIVLRHIGIPATITPSGEIRVSHGKLDAVACAERTVYTWRAGVVA